MHKGATRDSMWTAVALVSFSGISLFQAVATRRAALIY